MTPSLPKRGMSSGRRCWACSILHRRSPGPFTAMAFSKMSRMRSLALSPMAWTATWMPVAVGLEDALLHGAFRGHLGMDDARVPGVVRVRLVEHRGPGPEPAVAEGLQARDAEEVVPERRAHLQAGEEVDAGDGDIEVDPARQLPGPIQVLVGFEGRGEFVGEGHFMDRRHAALGGVGEGGLDRPDIVLERRGRDQRGHEVHGRFLEDPRRLARRRVLEDLAAGRRRGVLGDAGHPQGDAVGQPDVEVVAPDEHGILRRFPVDPFLGGQGRRIDPLLVPGPVEDPGPLLHRGDLGRESGGELLPAPDVLELDAREGVSALKEMGMAVDESRKDELAVEPDDRRPLGRGRDDLGVRSDAGDASLADEDGLGPRPGRVHRPDPPADEEEVFGRGLGNGRHRRREAGQAQEQGQDSRSHL